MTEKKTLILLILGLVLILSGCQGQEPHKSTEGATGGSKKMAESHMPKKPEYIYGTVKETMNGGGYTYMLLEFDGKESWVAVPQMKVAVGDEVMLYPGNVMTNFHSKSLNKTFDTIIFSQGPVDKPSGHGAGEDSSSMSAQAHSGAPKIAKSDIKIEPATGKNAITIAEAYKRAKELDGKKVVLKAVVMKVSKNILGKNWLHCQDGTGTEAEKNYDITVTTKALPAVGDVVLIKGTLHKDKDIGAGYFYPVIIEDAEVTVLKNKKK
ncbi:MAG: DNA-binding protein [Thermodesulfobacteria bacterium]|nr:DNA-binding protein [Thermodesulfobacteriota bacterium]